MYPHRKTKFRNVWTEVDGIKFQSKKEARDYKNLQLASSAGLIKDLRLQVTFKLTAHGKLICRYRADFVYFDVELGREVIHDSKGFQTPEFKLKWKLLDAEYGSRYFLRLT